MNLPPLLRVLVVAAVLVYGAWTQFSGPPDKSGPTRDSRGGQRVEDRRESKDGKEEAGGDHEDEGSLAAEERAGGHLIRKHVGQTTEQLQARLARERQLNTVSTFPDLPTAETAVKETLRSQRGRIERWLNERSDRLALSQRFDRVIGVTLRRGDREPRPARSLRLVLVRDRRESDGYRILTGYPAP